MKLEAKNRLLASAADEADKIGELIESLLPKSGIEWDNKFGFEEIVSTKPITDAQITKIGQKINDLLHPMGFSLNDTSDKYGTSMEWVKGKTSWELKRSLGKLRMIRSK